jgi:4-hydroxy-tetrahydrodipicolinate synthase
MGMTRTFRGVFSFSVTPTRDDGEKIDHDRFREFLDFQIEQGVHGIAVFGSTGSNGSFTEEEKRETMKMAVKHVKGRVTLIFGTGAITTAEAVRQSKYAEDAGADGLLVVPITYWPLTENEVYEHYTAIARAVKIPITIYNNPWTTGVDIKPPLVARLSEIDNIRCIKESSGDLTRITTIRRLTRGKMTVFAGWESNTLQAFMAGAEGWFSGMTNLTPRECVELFDLAVEKNDMVRSRELFDRLFPLCDFMCQKSHVRVAHTALELLGRPMGPPRRPLRMLEPQDRAELERLLKEFGALKKTKKK